MILDYMRECLNFIFDSVKISWWIWSKCFNISRTQYNHVQDKDNKQNDLKYFFFLWNLENILSL